MVEDRKYKGLMLFESTHHDVMCLCCFHFTSPVRSYLLSLVRDRRTTVYLKDFFFPVENNPEAIEAIKREANLVSMWQANITLVDDEIVVDEPLCKSRRCY